MNYSRVLDGIVRLSSIIHPVWLKRLVLLKIFAIFSIVHRLKSIVLHVQLPVCIASGVEKRTGEILRVLFVGGHDFPKYLKEILFSEIATVEELKPVFIWKVKNLKRKYGKDVDAVFVSCDQFYQRFFHQDDFFVFPHMVDMNLDSFEGLVDISNRFSRNTKRDIKKIKEQNFSYEITTDIDKLKMFYYDMFLPTLSERIGKRDTFTPDFVFFKYLLETGYELMMFTVDDEYVCGGFFIHNKDTAFLRYSGVYQGKFSLLQKGASAAIYYFFICEVLKRKTKKIVFGGTRPFFNDGLFQYKKKWGMKVESYDLLNEIFGLKIVNTECEPLKEFLFHNPFIGLTDRNELVGYVFVRDDEIDDELKENYEKKLYIPGITKLRFIKL